MNNPDTPAPKQAPPTILADFEQPVSPFPAPPKLAEAIGYHGAARCIGLFWQSDDANFSDGCVTSSSGNWSVFRNVLHHPYYCPLFDQMLDQGIHFGNLDEFGTPATHWLVLDRALPCFYILKADEARRFLRTQHAPPISPGEGAFQEDQKAMVVDLESPEWSELMHQAQERIAQVMRVPHLHPADVMARLQYERELEAEIVRWMSERYREVLDAADRAG